MALISGRKNGCRQGRRGAETSKAHSTCRAITD
jgi:hypothetical protein